MLNQNTKRFLLAGLIIVLLSQIMSPLFVLAQPAGTPPGGNIDARFNTVTSFGGITNEGALDQQGSVANSTGDVQVDDLLNVTAPAETAIYASSAGDNGPVIDANNSGTGTAVSGTTVGGTAVYGSATDTSVQNFGVWGTTNSASGYGGYFRNWNNSGGGIALYASSTANGYAGIFWQGNVGIGTVTPTERLEVIGNVLSENVKHYNFWRTLPTVVQDIVEIGYFTIASDAQSLDVSVTTSGANYSIAKRYLITSQLGQNSDWEIAVPISSSGANASNNFDLDVKQVDGTHRFYLRLRKTQGSATGAAEIHIQQRGDHETTFTPTTGTGSVSAPTAYFGSTVLTQVDGNVGIGTPTPTQMLDVDGAVRLQHALYDGSNSAGASTNILTSTGSATSWVAASSAISESDPNAVLKTAYTAEGDILVGTGSATYSALGHGTNGQVLKSNGTTAVWDTDAGLTSETQTLQDVTTLGATTTTASSFTGGATVRGLTVDTATSTQDRIAVNAAAVGTARFDGTITNADLTGSNKTWTLPNETGTICTTGSVCSGYQAEGALTSETDPVVKAITGVVTSNGTTLSGRTITAGTGVSVSNGNGVSGNPTVSMDYTATLAGDPALTAGQAVFDSGDAGGGVLFEGATANGYEGLLTTAALASADRTWTLPDSTGTLLTSEAQDLAAVTAIGATTSTPITVSTGTTGNSITGTTSSTTAGQYAVYGNATGTSASNATYGVAGTSASAAGYGGYFTNTNVTSGTGLYASSTAGDAAYINGSMQLIGTLKDSSGHAGASTNILTSTGSAIDWVAASSAFTETDPTLINDGAVTLGSNSATPLTITLDTSGSDGSIVMDGFANELEITAGEVGIGTTSPTSKLHVNSGGTETAVYGYFDSTNIGSLGLSGYGVYGVGGSYGVAGTTASTTGQGVSGSASSGTGTNFGVYGSSASSSGTGVYGSASDNSGTTYGVQGNVTSTSGTGVYGNASAGTGGTYGVRGAATSATGFGVHGTNANNIGIYGTGARGVYGTGTTGGVHGVSTAASGFGVKGEVSGTSASAVFGESTATSGTNSGVYGTNASPSGYGGSFANTSTTGNAVGVYGSSASAAGYGVYGTVTNTGSGTTYGVAGTSASSTGYGGYFTATTTGGIGLYAAASSSIGYAAVFPTGYVGIGTAAPGSALDVKGTMRLSGATSGYVGFTAPVAAGTQSYTLPSAVPTVSGQVLAATTGGVMSWAADAGLTSESDPVWVAAEPNYFNLGQNVTVTGIPAFNGGTTGASAPFSVDSTYAVSNLNADLLDGNHASAFLTSYTETDPIVKAITGVVTSNGTTLSGRTITAGTGVSVSNGNGVSGNPTVSMDYTATLASNSLTAGQAVFDSGDAGGGILFEGATAADGIEGLLTVTDPAASDKTWTLPNETGTICTTGSVCSGYMAAGGGYWTRTGAALSPTTYNDYITNSNSDASHAAVSGNNSGGYYGVSGSSTTSDGVHGSGAVGVSGYSGSSTGTGVYGQADGTGGSIAVKAENTAASGAGYGLYASSLSTTAGAAAVYGNATGAAATYGVAGRSTSSTGYGGYFTNSSSGAGLYASSTSGLALEVRGTGLTNQAKIIDNAAAGSRLGSALYFDSTTTDWVINATGPNSGAGDSRFVIRDYSNAANRFAIDSTGNVGIGTTSPGAKLDVVGTGAGIYSTTPSTTPGDYAIKGDSTGASGAVYGVYGTSASSAGYGGYFTSTNVTSGTGLYASSTAGTAIRGQYSANFYGDIGRSDYGVYGTSSPGTDWGALGAGASQAGVEGHGALAGVYGVSATNGVYGTSSAGNGVYGYTSAASGNGGTFTNANATAGSTALYASASAAAGVGVYGTSPYKAVSGVATGSSGANFGVWGSSASSSGKGVYGEATDSAGGGTTSGVYGTSASSRGYGVYGNASSASGGVSGVYGNAANASGYGVYGNNGASGYYGYLGGGGNYGVYGYGFYAVEGHGDDGTSIGSLGNSDYGAGVYGQGDTYGGYFLNTSSGVGLYASSASGPAAIFNGGKVGIGSATAPTHNLTVYSSDSETMRLYSGGINGAGARFNFGDGDYVYIEEDLDDYLTIYASNRTAIMGGNVGIGTLSTAAKLDVKSTQTSGTLQAIGAPSAVTLAGALAGLNVNLSTNYTAAGQSVIGQQITMPSVANTGAGSYVYRGIYIPASTLSQDTGAGANTWTGLDITMPTLSQTQGSISSTGLKITGGTASGTTTRYGMTIDANAGNVGIGTTTPSLGRLHVSATGAQDAIYGINPTSGQYGYLGGGSLAGVYGYGSNGVYGGNSGGVNYGVLGSASYGVYGTGAGVNTGVRGDYDANNYGYMGTATYGVFGNSSNTAGYGVYGRNVSGTGTTYGVYGTSASSGGYGGYFSNTGSGYGLYGATNSTTAAFFGVRGHASGTSGTTYGVYGSNDSAAGYGVYGITNSASSTGWGVYGSSSTTQGGAGAVRGSNTGGGSAQTYGVYGDNSSSGGMGVYGTNSSAGYGVYGTNSSTGVGGYFRNSSTGIPLTAVGGTATNQIRITKTYGSSGSMDMFVVIGTVASTSGDTLCTNADGNCTCLAQSSNSTTKVACATPTTNQRVLCAGWGD